MPECGNIKELAKYMSVSNASFGRKRKIRSRQNVWKIIMIDVVILLLLLYPTN